MYVVLTGCQGYWETLNQGWIYVFWTFNRIHTENYKIIFLFFIFFYKKLKHISFGVFIWLNLLKLKNNTQVRGSPAPRKPSSLIGWFEHRCPQSQQQRRAREFRNFGWVLPSGKRVSKETLAVQDLGIWTPHAFTFSGRCQNNLLNVVFCSDVRVWNPKVFFIMCAHFLAAAPKSTREPRGRKIKV